MSLQANGTINAGQHAQAVCHALAGAGYADAEWLAELQDMTASELEQLLEVVVQNPVDMESAAWADNGSEWVLPGDASSQIVAAERRWGQEEQMQLALAEEQEVVVPPLVLHVDHADLDGGTTGRVYREGTEADSYHPWRRDSPTKFRKAKTVHLPPSFLGQETPAPGIVSADPAHEISRNELSRAMADPATAKPFAAGVYGFTPEGSVLRPPAPSLSVSLSVSLSFSFSVSL